MANTIIKADQGINELIVITAFYKFYNEQNTTELQIKLKELFNKSLRHNKEYYNTWHHYALLNYDLGMYY